MSGWFTVPLPSPGAQLLAAYAVLEPVPDAVAMDEAALAAELKALCRTHLPPPAVPGALQVLDLLPRSAAGKLDRSALPFPKSPPPTATDTASEAPGLHP